MNYNWRSIMVNNKKLSHDGEMWFNQTRYLNNDDQKILKQNIKKYEEETPLEQQVENILDQVSHADLRERIHIAAKLLSMKAYEEAKETLDNPRIYPGCQESDICVKPHIYTLIAIESKADTSISKRIKGFAVFAYQAGQYEPDIISEDIKDDLNLRRFDNKPKDNQQIAEKLSQVKRLYEELVGKESLPEQFISEDYIRTTFKTLADAYAVSNH